MQLYSHLQQGLSGLRKHTQFGVTLLLLVAIPVGFLISGQRFLSISKAAQERAERGRIGLLHDAVAAFAKREIHTDDRSHLISEIVAQNPDITKFVIFVYRDGAYAVDTSYGDIGDVGQYREELRESGTRDDESLIFETSESGVRHWLGVRALPGNPIPTTFILTDMSMEAQDSLYASEIKKTYVYLLGIVLLLMVLVLRHARIINYSELYKKLKEALGAKTTFITMTAHELRAPLTAMRGYASMIRESSETSSESKKYAERIEDSSKYMIGLVSDMLDLAKMDSGSMVLQKDICSVKEVAQGLVERLGALGKDHTIALVAEPISEDLIISIDRTRFEQILTNLISNAIKYTREGGVTLAASVVHGKCEIRIKDTGTGMTAEDQHKLFSPFFRTEDAESSEVVGTGLGMWITKQFIENMGGTVAVESIHGVGTHVVVRFPLSTAS